MARGVGGVKKVKVTGERQGFFVKVIHEVLVSAIQVFIGLKDV